MGIKWTDGANLENLFPLTKMTIMMAVKIIVPTNERKRGGSLDVDGQVTSLRVFQRPPRRK